MLAQRNQREASPAPRSLPAAEPVTARLTDGTVTAFLRELFAVAPDGSGWENFLRPGAVVGRFELVREIGRGGFGVVWEAHDLELRRQVAFKAMRRGAGSETRLKRLMHEAQAAARLSHPNIVTLHEVGHAEGGPYLVLELLRGETLARRLKGPRLRLDEALPMACQIAAGLAHAHEHGVVHRDLTPSNVFLCEEGQLKVLDLGLALAFGGRRLIAGGTPTYMAPEQQRGAPEDERTDVFALGVLIHQMVAGALPFGDSGAAIGRAPVLQAPGATGLPELVERMLKVDPVKRPRDAGVVLTELRAIAKRATATSDPLEAPGDGQRARGGQVGPPVPRTGR